MDPGGVKEAGTPTVGAPRLNGDMATLMLLILLAPDAEAEKVPEVARLLGEDDTAGALEVLREVGAMAGNHAEAKALVKLVRDPKLDVDERPEVLEACFVALKGIGSREITRDLKALLRHSRLKKITGVRVGVCRALEGSADPGGIETLLDLLRDTEDEVVAAASEAASAHRYAKESQRKELFEKIMDIYVGTWNLKNAVNPDLKVEKRRAERKWEVVEKSMERALQLLSNTTQNDPPAWRHWWNKNKNKRWGELER